MGWPGDRVGGNPTEEGPGSTGQGGGQQPPEVTRGTVPQKTDRHRLRAVVRVKRWCKRPPARRATVVARQTPPGARPDSERSRAARPSSRVGRTRVSATALLDGWSPTVPSRGGTANRTRPMSQPIRTRDRGPSPIDRPVDRHGPDDHESLTGWPMYQTG